MKRTNNELELLALEMSYRLRERGLHSLVSLYQMLAKIEPNKLKRAQIASVALSRGLVTLQREAKL